MLKKTLAVDFDGVLHNYSDGWRNGEIYDGPKPGAASAMKVLRDMGYEIVIYSARCFATTIEGRTRNHQRREMAAWLKRHKIPYDRIHTTPDKPWCCLFIDDNAYRFKKDWNTELFNVIAILGRLERGK